MDNKIRFTLAHKRARMIAHIVGDYQIAFTIALRESYQHNPVNVVPVKRTIKIDWFGLVLLAIISVVIGSTGFLITSGMIDHGYSVLTSTCVTGVIMGIVCTLMAWSDTEQQINVIDLFKA